MEKEDRDSIDKRDTTNILFKILRDKAWFVRLYGEIIHETYTERNNQSN